MKILALDTSSNVASVAVVTEDKLLGDFTLNLSKTHSQKLMPIVDGLLSNLELGISDLDGIAVSAGPGSFTGLRIGVTAAKSFAQPLDLPVIPVSTIEAMAWNLPGFDGLVCPIMDARRGQVYTGVYQWNQGKMEAVLEDQAILLVDLLDWLKENTQEAVCFLGDGIPKFTQEVLEGLPGQAVIAPVSHGVQRASSVGALALTKWDQRQSYLEVDADYLRKSEAERNLDAKRQAAKE